MRSWITLLLNFPLSAAFTPGFFSVWSRFTQEKLKVYVKQFSFDPTTFKVEEYDKDFSRTYTQIQGLFKEKWNSRTFQGLPLKFKDFSRLCEPWNLSGCLWNWGFENLDSTIYVCLLGYIMTNVCHLSFHVEMVLWSSSDCTLHNMRWFINCSWSKKKNGIWLRRNKS